ALSHVLGGLTPDVAPQEQRLAVSPLPALAVVDARRRRDGEVGDRGTGRREAQFGVGGQVSHDGDDGVTSHDVLLGLAVEVCERSQASLRKRSDVYSLFFGTSACPSA